jgi:hypothetical protein
MSEEQQVWDEELLSIKSASAMVRGRRAVGSDLQNFDPTR